MSLSSERFHVWRSDQAAYEVQVRRLWEAVDEESLSGRPFMSDVAGKIDEKLAAGYST